MKTVYRTSDQHTLITSLDGPHTDRIDRITTGYGSDNLQTKAVHKLLNIRRLQVTEAARPEKNLSGADPMHLIRQLIPTSARNRTRPGSCYLFSLVKIIPLHRLSPGSRRRIQDANIPEWPVLHVGEKSHHGEIVQPARRKPCEKNGWDARCEPLVKGCVNYECFSGCTLKKFLHRHGSPGTGSGNTDGMRRSAKFSKARKPAPRLEIQIRGALQLPKHIRENIRHPLLRLGWLAEINGAAAVAPWR